MRRAEEFLQRQRWQPVYNAGAVEIPPFGVLYTARSTTKVDGTLQATSPLSTDNYNHNLLSFNGPTAIPAGKYGSCTQDYPCLAKVNASAPFGTVLGTEADQFSLYSEDDDTAAPWYFGLYRGFRSLGMVGDYALVVPQAQGQCCRGVGIPEELCLTFSGTDCDVGGFCNASGGLTLTWGTYNISSYVGGFDFAYGWGYESVSGSNIHQVVFYCSSHLSPYGLQPPPYTWILWYVCKSGASTCVPTTTVSSMSCDPLEIEFTSDALVGPPTMGAGTFTITECP